MLLVTLSLLLPLLLLQTLVDGSTPLFVKELTRSSDGFQFTCKPSAYYHHFAANLSHWTPLKLSWSSSFIDNLTSRNEPEFYYNRIQIVDGKLSYERGDYWQQNYDATRPFPEHYFSDLLSSTLDYIQYLLNTYDASKYLPNVDFLILGSEYYYKWPSYFTTDYPVFRFENSHPDHNLHHAWLLPSREYVQQFDVIKWHHEMSEVVDPETGSLSNSARVPWRDRTDKAVFRGSVYQLHDMRLKVLETLLQHGNASDSYFDVKMSLSTVVRDTLSAQHAERSGHFELNAEDMLTDLEQMQSKFVIVIDGTVSPDRVARQLLYGSVMILQVSRFKSMFFDDLVPYKHFVPWTDPEDLYNKVTYYLDLVHSNNSSQREAMISYLTDIGLNGMKWALEHFNSQYMDCHMINMLHLYSHTFEKVNLAEASLKNRMEFNREHRQEWMQHHMNKTIVVDANVTSYSRQIWWPVEKADSFVVQQVHKMIAENAKGIDWSQINRLNYDAAKSDGLQWRGLRKLDGAVQNVLNQTHETKVTREDDGLEQTQSEDLGHMIVHVHAVVAQPQSVNEMQKSLNIWSAVAWNNANAAVIVGSFVFGIGCGFCSKSFKKHRAIQSG